MSKIIFSIETSCDETAMAIIEARGGTKRPKFRILKNLVASQVETHQPWGGVVPNLAKREHLKNLPILLEKVLVKKNGKTINPDIIAVTVGPGLEPALWTGINFAKEVQKKHFPKAELIGANHLEGHLFSFMLEGKGEGLMKAKFPAIQLLVSGGHTILILMNSLTKYEKLGETRDDAAGEAFDKVARMLGLPYPGGPAVSKIARDGNPDATYFPRPMIFSKNYDFSFSGLKTSVLYYLKDNKNRKKEDVAASFEKAVIETLIRKTEKSILEKGAKTIILSGGVAANSALRSQFRILGRRTKINFVSAPIKFQTDNAAMIGVSSYINYLQRKNRRLVAKGTLGL